MRNNNDLVKNIDIFETLLSIIRISKVAVSKKIYR